MKPFTLGVVSFAALSAASSVALAVLPQYSLTRLPTPEGFLSQASGVSTAGVVGSTDNGAASMPALWTDSGRVDLPLLEDFTRGFANGVNNAGVVVGSVGKFHAPSQAVQWVNGQPSFLPTEDSDDDDTEFLFGSIASAVNANGVIVGQATNQYGDTGVVWTPDGGVRLLMGLAPKNEPQFSWAQSINNNGVITGWARDENGLGHAMRWDGDVATPLGTFVDGGETFAHAVNNNGDIVGWGTEDDEHGSAFVYSNDTLTPLPRLTGTDYGEAFAISDDGLIVGQSLGAGIEGRGFATLWLNGQAYDLEQLIAPGFGASEWQLLSTLR